MRRGSHPHAPVVIAALLCGMASVPLHAQGIDSPYRFVEETQSAGVFGGYALTNEGALGLGPSSGPLAGLRYSLRINGPFTLEGETAYLPTSRTVVDTATVDGERNVLGDADLPLLLLDASLRFNVTGPRTYHDLLPYVLVGGGGVIALDGEDTLDRELDPGVAFDFGTTFAAHIGAGVEWYVTRRIGIRADAKDVFWQIEAPSAFAEQDLNVPTEEWLQNFFLTLGLTYRF